MAKKQFKPPVASNVDEFIGGGAATVTDVQRNKVGRPQRNSEPTKAFNCNLPVSVFKKLKLDAAVSDVTMTDIIVELLNDKYK